MYWFKNSCLIKVINECSFQTFYRLNKLIFPEEYVLTTALHMPLIHHCYCLV